MFRLASDDFLTQCICCFTVFRWTDHNTHTFRCLALGDLVTFGSQFGRNGISIGFIGSQGHPSAYHFHLQGVYGLFQLQPFLGLFCFMFLFSFTLFFCLTFSSAALCSASFSSQPLCFPRPYVLLQLPYASSALRFSSSLRFLLQPSALPVSWQLKFGLLLLKLLLF